MIRQADIIVHTRSGSSIRERLGRITDLQEAMNAVKMEPKSGRVEYLCSLSSYYLHSPEKSNYTSSDGVHQHVFAVFAEQGEQPCEQEFTRYLLGLSDALGALGARFIVAQSNIKTDVRSGGAGEIGVPVETEKPTIKSYKVTMTTNAAVEHTSIVSGCSEEAAKQVARMSVPFIADPKNWRVAGIICIDAVDIEAKLDH
jgi:hypothetical protein